MLRLAYLLTEAEYTPFIFVYLAYICLAYISFRRIKTSFLPNESWNKILQELIYSLRETVHDTL